MLHIQGTLDKTRFACIVLAHNGYSHLCQWGLQGFLQGAELELVNKAPGVLECQESQLDSNSASARNKDSQRYVPRRWVGAEIFGDCCW